MAHETTGNFSHIPDGNQNFLIMEQPKDSNLSLYYDFFARYNVKHVVRVCPQETYNITELQTRGIDCHAFPYADGNPPPNDVVEPWLQPCAANKRVNKEAAKGEPAATIAIHCVAGLGRAPVLVAIALIENGMDYLKAVETIREVRRGAINKPQVDFLKNYEKKSKKSSCACM